MNRLVAKRLVAKRLTLLGALIASVGLMGACERHSYSETPALFEPHGAGSAGHAASQSHSPGQPGKVPAGSAGETKSFFEGESH